jgi:hypothetical protein
MELNLENKQNHILSKIFIALPEKIFGSTHQLRVLIFLSILIIFHFA